MIWNVSDILLNLDNTSEKIQMKLSFVSRRFNLIAAYELTPEG